MRLPEIDLSSRSLAAFFSSVERASSQVVHGLRLSLAALMLSACNSSMEGAPEPGLGSGAPSHDAVDTAPAAGDTSADSGNRTPTYGDSGTEDTGEDIADIQDTPRGGARQHDPLADE